MRRVLFILIGLTLASAPLYSQWISGRSIPELRRAAAAGQHPSRFRAEPPGLRLVSAEDGPRLFPGLSANPTTSPDRSEAPPLPRPGAIYPEGHFYDVLGFFCKVEVDVARQVRFPIKMRLGEVQYVERMEGKKGYWRP